MTNGLTKDDLLTLSKPFDKETLGVKVQSLSKDRTKALLVLYLQHTDVASRLDQVDPTWSFHVKITEHKADHTFLLGALTIKGTTRENYGEGQDQKSAASDCLKRCAMLFGVGRDLYDSELVWVPYNEQTDKYKVWTIEQYLAKAKKPLPQSAPIDNAYPKAMQYMEGPPPGLFDDEDIPEHIGGPIDKKASPLADYEIKFGVKHRGKKLGEIYEKELKSYVKYVEEGVNQSPHAIEFVKTAKEYLEATR